MTELLVSAFLLDLLFDVVPGAVFAESLRPGLRGGFGPALAVQVGSLVGDLAWAVLGLLGAAALFSLPVVQTPLALLGAAFLTWLAWQALRDGIAPVPAFDPEDGRAGRGPALLSGVALSLPNPVNVTYWAGLGGTVAALGAADPSWTDSAVLLAGFMASSVLWCFLCAGLIARTRAHVGPATWGALHVGSAAGLAYFAWRVASRVVDPRPQSMRKPRAAPRPEPSARDGRIAPTGREGPSGPRPAASRSPPKSAPPRWCRRSAPTPATPWARSR